MMTFKELVDKATVKWAFKLIDEKQKNLGDELALINKDNLLPGINFDPQEAVNEFDRIKSQLPVLKTYADVFGYAKLNETDINAMFTGQGSAQLANLFNGSTPDIAKLLAKLQLGTVFYVINGSKSIVTTLLDKIGRETPIDKVEVDDINYLITKEISPEIDNLIKSDEGINYLDEIKDELLDMTNISSEWSKKVNDVEVANIYLDKQRDQFLNSPAQQAILTQGAPLNSARFKVAQHAYSAMSGITGQVKLGSEIYDELMKDMNN